MHRLNCSRVIIATRFNTTYNNLEPKWGPLFWLKFGPCFGGLTFKNRGQLVLGIYIIISHWFLATWTPWHQYNNHGLKRQPQLSLSETDWSWIGAPGPRMHSRQKKVCFVGIPDPKNAPSGKLRWLAGIFPCSIGNTSSFRVHFSSQLG